MFEKEITECYYSDLYKVAKVEGEALPMEVLVDNVEDTLPDGVKVTGVTVSSSPDDAYKVNLSKPRRASIYVDQYSGEVKGRYERLPFFGVMFRLHRWLMDSNNNDGGIFWGKMIVGTSTLVFVVILITGVAMWIPHSKKALKNRLLVNTKKGMSRFLYDLHVAGGMYVAIVLLALALTGLTWSFGWYRTGFYKLFGVEQVQGGHGAVANRAERGEQSGRKLRGGKETVNYGVWHIVCEELAKRNPEYKQITVSDGSATVAFGGWGNQRASDKYTFDALTGKITDSNLYKDADKSSKIRGWIYSVHVGSWGGMFTRVVVFLAALLGASLPLTGYYLWIKRIRAKKKAKRRFK